MLSINRLIDEGIASALGALTGEGTKVRERVRSGFSVQDFNRVEGPPRTADNLYQEMQTGGYQELPRGPIARSENLDVLGRGVQVGVPAGWTARDAGERALMPGGGPDSQVCAALYREDADPGLVYSLQVLAVSDDSVHTEGGLDPALWLLSVERQTGLRAVGRVMCARLDGERAFVWHLAGTMPGAAVGRPYEGTVEVRSSELWCSLPSRFVKVLLVAPPEKAREGQQAFSTLAASWKWI